MTTSINYDDLTTSLNNINNAKIPNDYGIKSIKIDTQALTSNALSANSASTTPTDKCNNSVTEQKYTTPVEQWVTGDGFTIKETNPPKLPKKEPNDRPKKGSPSSPGTYYRGVNCETGIGVANLNLSYSCNFVTGINLDSCLFKLQKTIDIRLYRLVRKAWWTLFAHLQPVADHFRNLVESLCRIIKEILKIICFIKMLINCILSTIKAITQIISWIMSMPVRFLAMLMQCVNSFLSSILNTLNSMLSAVKSIFSGISTCFSGWSCPDTSSSVSG